MAAGDPEIDVLIVDDDEAIAEFVSVVLSQHGYRVAVARDGLQAINILRHTPARLLLLDLMLPIMDGWDLARAVRANPKLKDTPIVVLSALDELPDESQGVNGYLRKPFDIDDLFSCVAANISPRGRDLVSM